MKTTIILILLAVAGVALAVKNKPKEFEPKSNEEDQSKNWFV